MAKQDSRPMPYEYRLPWEHIDYLTIWMEPVPCHLPRFSGSLCSVTVLGVCSQARVVWCNAKGVMIHTNRDAEGQETETQSQLTDEHDDRLMNRKQSRADG